MPLRSVLGIAVATSLVCASAVAQQKDTRSVQEKLSGFDLQALRKANPTDKAAIRDGIDVDQHLLAFVYYAMPPTSVKTAFDEFLKPIEAARVDQQLQGSSSAGGTTSAVAKSGLTSLVSFALESGALTQTIQQNVATFHANGDGLYRFVTNQQVIPVCASDDNSCQPSWAKNLDLSASFNISNGGNQTLTGQTATSGAPVNLSTLLNKHQFSSATVQYAIWNKRDFRSKAYHDSFIKWFKANSAALRAAGSALTAAVGAFLNPVERQVGATPGSTLYSEWIAGTTTTPGAINAVAEALKKDPSSVQVVLAQQLDTLVATMQKEDPQFSSKLQALSEAYTTYFSTEDNLGRNMITAPELSIQATYSQPTLQPNVISATLAYEMSPGSKSLSDCGNTDTQSQDSIVRATSPIGPSPSCANPGTLTLNAGVDMYQDPQPTTVGQSSSRFRGAQAAVQFDRPIGAATSPAQLSIGAYYQYQLNAGVFTVPAGATTIPNTNIPLPATGSTVLTNTKGSLYAVQAVVNVQIPSAGLKIPIGISWSNSTDLVKGNTVRFHVGFTFNSEGALLNTKR